jgi:hypothetical protein
LADAVAGTGNDMKVQCKICGIHLEAPPGCEGRKLRCPECGGVFVASIPRAALADEPAHTPPADEPVLLEDVVQTEPLAPSPPEPPEEEPIELTEEAGTPADVLAKMGQGKPQQLVRPSARQWHVLVAGVPAVALTYPELRRKAAAGEIKPRTKVHYVPRDLTMRAGDVPGLFPEAKPRPPVRPAPPVRTRRAAPRAGASDADALAGALGAMGTAGTAPDTPAEDAGDALEQLGRAVEDAEPEKN